MREVPNPHLNPSNEQRSRRLDKPLEENMERFQNNRLYAHNVSPKEVLLRASDTEKQAYIMTLVLMREEREMTDKFERGAVRRILQHTDVRFIWMALWRLYDRDLTGDWRDVSGNPVFRGKSPFYYGHDVAPRPGIAEILACGEWKWIASLQDGSLRTFHGARATNEEIESLKEERVYMEDWDFEAMCFSLFAVGLIR